MSDTVNGISGSGYGLYMEPDCDEQDQVCYGDSPAAAPAALHTVVDSVEDSCDDGADPAMPCASDPPDAQYGHGALRQPGDRPVGNGEGAILDKAERREMRRECRADTTVDYNNCVAEKEEAAYDTCSPARGAGVRNDNRAVEPGHEQECVDGWVYGTDSRTTSHAENEEGTTGTEDLDEKGGSVRAGGKIGPVEIGGEGNWKRSRTDIKLKTKGTTDEESRTRSGQDGSVQECEKAMVEAQR